MLEGRAILEKQLCWQVGDGSRIKVSSDLWIPGSYPFMIPPESWPALSSRNIYWVKDLMLNSRQWNKMETPLPGERAEVANMKRCNADTESIMHCLCYCKKAEAVWREEPMNLSLIGRKTQTFWDFWNDKLENCRLGLSDTKELARIAITCWGIWRARNAWVFEQTMVDPKSTMEARLKMFKELGVETNPRNHISPISTPS
ncbi:hypothetical protein PIB30_012741 [Stylosanthes scabra]|uniref:Reverse transcriptase zinc-binding domain-containing protein n=1 Tax=Stylosanthes scabra TaxID=79078 RepID=A0ABU6R554_9FABA|nr:hypothetical protein [Stylosanthes scabra]